VQTARNTHNTICQPTTQTHHSHNQSAPNALTTPDAPAPHRSAQNPAVLSPPTTLLLALELGAATPPAPPAPAPAPADLDPALDPDLDPTLLAVRISSCPFLRNAHSRSGGASGSGNGLGWNNEEPRAPEPEPEFTSASAPEGLSVARDCCALRFAPGVANVTRIFLPILAPVAVGAPGPDPDIVTVSDTCGTFSAFDAFGVLTADVDGVADLEALAAVANLLIAVPGSITFPFGS
jgi:hypothetical protein